MVTAASAAPYSKGHFEEFLWKWYLYVKNISIFYAVVKVPPPSCPLLRRTISCLAPMLPSMASSSLAFMSLDFLKVKLFILSNAFFPCMVNTTWALYPRGRGWNDKEHSGKVIYITALSQKIQVSRGERNGSIKRKLTPLHVCLKHTRMKACLWKAGSCWYFISTFNSQSISAQKLLLLTARVSARASTQETAVLPCTQSKRHRGRGDPAGGSTVTQTNLWTISVTPSHQHSSVPTADRWEDCDLTRPWSYRVDDSPGRWRGSKRPRNERNVYTPGSLCVFWFKRNSTNYKNYLRVQQEATRSRYRGSGGGSCYCHGNGLAD